MKKTVFTALLLIILLSIAIGGAQAQDVDRGTIQGLVYEDVDGDGLCVNTGVKGEEPVEGIDIEFVSSDEKTIITLYSGPEGIYGLFAAGQSYWRVTAKPNADWVVTSENPLWAPLSDGEDVVVGVNFCVQKANAAGTSATVILPVSGGSQNNLTSIAAVMGSLFVLAGFGLEYRRRLTN